MTDIEIKLAHLDQSVAELSDVLYAQQKLIDKLEANYKLLKERLDASADGADRADSQDEKPPHY